MVQSINIDTQKIDVTIFETYKMIVTAFSVIDQADKVRFFEKIFLVANFNPDMVFRMLFLTLNSVNNNISKKKL